MIQKVSKKAVRGEQRLPWPKLIRLINPLEHLRWLYGFVRAWLGTRLYSRVLPSIPFICILIALAVWRLTPPPKLARVYEQARDAAAREDNSDLANLAVNRLIRMNPGKDAYRYALALNYLEDGRMPDAVRILHGLAPVDSDTALALADLRLVTLASDATNSYSEPNELVIRRLSRVVQKEPQNFEAHRLLSVAYLEADQPLLAEPHLEIVCDGDAELMLKLAQLKVRNKKSDEARVIALKAEQLVHTAIQRGDTRPASAVLWSRLLRAIGKTRDAEQVLTERYRVDPENFREPLSQHYQTLARKQLAISPYYRRQAVVLLTRAMKVDPDDSDLAELIVGMARDRSQLAEGLLKQLATHWINRADAPNADAKTISMASLVCQSINDADNAIRLMKLAAVRDSAYQDSLVQTLHVFGQTDQDSELFETLKHGYQKALAMDPADDAARIRLSRLLISVGQVDDAERVLRSNPKQSARISKELVSVIRTRLASSDLNPEDSQQLAHEGLALAPLDSALLTRTAAIAQQRGSRGKRSREWILKLVTDGALPPAVAYAALGTAALDAENYRAAEEDLRRSAQLDRRNPLAWNNLALVLVRKKQPDAKLAIKAAEFALKLLPNHENLLATHGETLLAAERWADATEVLRKAVKMGKSRSEGVHRQLALAYRSLGNTELSNRHVGIADELSRGKGAVMQGVEE